MEMTPYRTWAVDVDGLKLPAPLGGHPVLDFCNTFAGWDDPEEHGDYLRTYDHLAVFAAAWDLIDDDLAGELRAMASARPGAARGALAAARDLRESIYRTLVRPGPGPELDHVAEAIRRSFDVADLVVEDGQPTWRLDASAGLRAPVHAVARSAAEFLTSPAAAGVGRCPGDGCGWLFLDRGGRRRWCTMSTCGNRAKARRFAERQRSSARDRR
jgi:predicted RNA-binding Zn ribbon-like protein